MQYGVLCLLPPAAMLIFALKTKKIFRSSDFRNPGCLSHHVQSGFYRTLVRSAAFGDQQLR